MSILGQHLKHLREGGMLVGNLYIISSVVLKSNNRFMICGSDRHVMAATGPLQEGLAQLIENTEGILLVSVESSGGTWQQLLIDLDKEIGNLAMQARCPLQVYVRNEVNDLLAGIDPDKVLTLPSNFEHEIDEALRSCRYHFKQHADGSFKLIKLK